MSDNSRKTPSTGTARRLQSQDERDSEGFAARKERDALAASRAPEFVAEEITGNYVGVELEERRARRPTDLRIKILENKHDELKTDLREVRSDVRTVSGQVSDLREDVAGAIGKINGQESVLAETLSIVKKTAEREHVTFTAKVEVDKAHELAKVEVGKAQNLAEIEVNKEEKADAVKAKSDRRKRNLKILGFVAGGVSLSEILHRLGVL